MTQRGEGGGGGPSIWDAGAAFEHQGLPLAGNVTLLRPDKLIDYITAVAAAVPHSASLSLSLYVAGCSPCQTGWGAGGGVKEEKL